jgi:eukaryotic-like serine/threonine-protein kinase
MPYPERVTAVFEAAVLREPAEREAYLREACDGDVDLRQQVEALLVDVERPALIDFPVAEAVVELLGDDSAVVIGKRLGPYQVDSLLGVGGMGEVYRASDTVLGRQVAIKVLPADVAADPERVARFRREARILASLNHPNVGAIYGVETLDSERGSATGLVLELVEGPTLADKLTTGAMALDEALTVARQIADALDAAHQLGIIHRDLKPGNIKVREDGTVKVLDFGLARVAAMDSDGGSPGRPRSPAASPTITSPAMTAAGIILGTAAYMSPEQAKGKPADKRSDIWAFGCVLYEMLTGRRAFEGEDVSDTLATLLRGEPDWTALPKDLPVPIGALLRGCLTKDRLRRVSDVSTLRFVLQNFDSLAPIHVGSAAPHVRLPLWRRLVMPAAAALVASGAVGAIVWSATRPPEPRVTRFLVVTSGTAALQFDVNARDLAVLPGGAIVYKAVAPGGRSRLWVRTRDQLEPTPFVETGSPRLPFSSPDGKWVGFFDSGPANPEMRKVAVTGGPTVLICSSGGLTLGVTWGDDDNIVFGTADPTTGLQRVSSAGGTPEVLTRPDRERGESDHVWPHYLPGSKAVLFTIMSTSRDTDTSQIAALDLQSGETKILVAGSQPHYTLSGHLVYVSRGMLMAVRFDADRLEVRGPSIAVTPELVTLGSGTAEFDIARDGTLVYVPAESQVDGPDRTLVWVDRQGREELAKVDRSRAYSVPRLSPDNTRVAVDDGSAGRNIWVLNLVSGAATRATLDRSTGSQPVWLDDQQIVYLSRSVGQGLPRLLRRNADGTGEAEPLTKTPTTPPMVVSSIAPPGGKNPRSILGSTFMGPSDVILLTLSDARIEPLLNAAYVERNPAISPDGRFVAYETNADGSFQIKVRPFPDVDGGQWTVSSQEGFQPAWALDGSALFYRAEDGAMMRVPVRSGPTWNAGSPTKLFDGRTFLRTTTTGLGRTYDVAKDGRFLMVKEPAADRTPSIAMVVVLNWFEELKRLVP